jgi:hypothetical protein
MMPINRPVRADRDGTVINGRRLNDTYTEKALLETANGSP